MNIKHRVTANTLELYLSGELDEHSSHSAREKLDDLIESCGKNIVVFNLENLNFMDSTGIGVLLGRYKKHKSCNMYIGGSNVYLDKLLKASGIFQIFNKIEE